MSIISKENLWRFADIWFLFFSKFVFEISQKFSTVDLTIWFNL